VTRFFKGWPDRTTVEYRRREEDIEEEEEEDFKPE
jgi:hypothetical protein